MWRDFDPRPQEPERPDLSRGGRGGGPAQHRDSCDPRDVFSRDLDLPREDARTPVRDRDRTIELRASEVRTLATVGAFRVVPASELRDHDGRPADARTGDLRHLRDEGLVRTMSHSTGNRRTTLVSLTDRGRDILDAHRSADRDDAQQRYYAGVAKPRELSHDSALYRAYLRAAERLRSSGASIRRVVLDYELKRDYQRFLADQNRERRRSEREPGDIEDAVARWAKDHDLPTDDGHVQFPDVRIEFERPGGERDVEDVEVMTPHYRGAMAAAKGRSGFTCYRVSTGMRARGGGGRGGLDPRLAEEFLR
jgi:DNA-binding MarR family transcriptional regulator